MSLPKEKIPPRVILLRREIIRHEVTPHHGVLIHRRKEVQHLRAAAAVIVPVEAVQEAEEAEDRSIKNETGNIKNYICHIRFIRT